MPRRSEARRVRGFLPLVALLSLAACGRSEPAPAPAPPDSGLGAQCTDCHEHLVEAWRGTAMARALGPLQPGELGGLNPVAEPAGGFSYHYARDAGRDVLVETAAGGHALAAPVAFA